MTFRPLPVMTALAVASLVILVLLGNWQYERYSEKRSAAPEDLPDLVEISGTVPDLPDRSVQHVYGIADAEPIWRRYVPLRLSGSGETVLLALDATGGPRPVQSSVPDGLDYSGAVRLFERDSRSSQRNRPEDNSWYVFDLQGILDAYALGPEVERVAEPVELVIRNADDLTRTRTTANPYGAPQPIDDLPPERHFGYALTWWGLAVALFVMYFVFHASQGRFSLKGR